MPTIFSHPAVPLALGLGLGKKFIPTRLLLAGVVGSILPDFDVIAFRFGIPYEDQFGHRGFSHSFFFAIGNQGNSFRVTLGLVALRVAGTGLGIRSWEFEKIALALKRVAVTEKTLCPST